MAEAEAARASERSRSPTKDEERDVNKYNFLFQHPANSSPRGQTQAPYEIGLRKVPGRSQRGAAVGLPGVLAPLGSATV